MKKIAAMILAIALLLGMVPVMAESADGTTMEYIPGIVTVGMIRKTLEDGKMAGAGFGFSMDFDAEKIGADAGSMTTVRDLLSSVHGSVLAGQTSAGFRVVFEGSFMPPQSKEMFNMELALTFEEKGFSLETGLLPDKRLYFAYDAAAAIASPEDVADVAMKATHGDAESIRTIAAEIIKRAGECVKKHTAQLTEAKPSAEENALLADLGNTLGAWIGTLKCEEETVTDAGDGITEKMTLTVTQGSVTDLGIALIDWLLADEYICKAVDEIIAKVAPMLGEQGEAVGELNAAALGSLAKMLLAQAKPAENDRELLKIAAGIGDNAITMEIRDAAGTTRFAFGLSGVGTDAWKTTMSLMTPAVEMTAEKTVAATETGETVSGRIEIKDINSGEVVTETETGIVEMKDDGITGSLDTEICLADVMKLGSRVELYTAEFDAAAYNAKETVSVLTATEDELKQLVEQVPESFKDLVKRIREAIPAEYKNGIVDTVRLVP